MIKPVMATVTRPADTTAYAAGDVIGMAASHILTFQVGNQIPSTRGFISRAMVIDSGAPATLPSLELWLFKTAPAAQADNTVFAVTDAELLDCIGVIPLTKTYIGLASGNHIQDSDAIGIPIQLAEGADSLYGVLVVRNAYTPISAEVFKVRLSVILD